MINPTGTLIPSLLLVRVGVRIRMRVRIRVRVRLTGTSRPSCSLFCQEVHIPPWSLQTADKLASLASEGAFAFYRLFKNCD
jgi:hypothetical protein